MANALLMAGALYGTEVEPLTLRQQSTLRQIMATAIWGDLGWRNRTITLLQHKDMELGSPRLP